MQALMQALSYKRKLEVRCCADVLVAGDGSAGIVTAMAVQARTDIRGIAIDAGEPPPLGGRLHPLIRIDHFFTRSHKAHKVDSIFRSVIFPSCLRVFV